MQKKTKESLTKSKCNQLQTDQFTNFKSFRRVDNLMQYVDNSRQSVQKKKELLQLKKGITTPPESTVPNKSKNSVENNMVEKKQNQLLGSTLQEQLDKWAQELLEKQEQLILSTFAAVGKKRKEYDEIKMKSKNVSLKRRAGSAGEAYYYYQM